MLDHSVSRIRCNPHNTTQHHTQHNTGDVPLEPKPQLSWTPFVSTPLHYYTIATQSMSLGGKKLAVNPVSVTQDGGVVGCVLYGMSVASQARGVLRLRLVLLVPPACTALCRVQHHPLHSSSLCCSCHTLRTPSPPHLFNPLCIYTYTG